MKNQNILKTCLTGRIGVNIYDENNQLKRTVYGNNLITTNGINRLTDMLCDFYNQSYPSAFTSFSMPSKASATLKDTLDFKGGIGGEIFGLNFIEWQARCKSVLNPDGFTNSSYFQNAQNMFDNENDSYARWFNNYRENTYWTPSGSKAGVYGTIIDLGLSDNSYDDDIYEDFMAPSVNAFYPVARKKLALRKHGCHG